MQLDILTTLQSHTRPVQGQNRVFPVYFSHTGKNLFTLAGIPVMKTGFSLLTYGMGLQCSDGFLKPLQCLVTAFRYLKSDMQLVFGCESVKVRYQQYGICCFSFLVFSVPRMQGVVAVLGEVEIFFTQKRYRIGFPGLST